MALRISRELKEAVRAAARAAAPQECCGLLLGDVQSGTVSAVLRATNVADDPLHCFEIDPDVLIAAHKNARAGGPAIIGPYHSHPAGEPIPSRVDARQAEGRGEIWLIVGQDDALAAWRAGPQGSWHGRFDPVEIQPAPE